MANFGPRAPSGDRRQRQDLQRPPRFEGKLTGTGAATDFTVTHNIATKFVHVTVYDDDSPWGEPAVTIRHTTINSVTVIFGAAPALGKIYRVFVSS